jgi:hypothetical protein
VPSRGVRALLAPDDLPLDLLLSAPDQLPEPLAEAVADPVERGELIGAVSRTSLLIWDDPQTARMHRLVQAVTLGRLRRADLRMRLTQAVGLLAALLPDKPWEPAVWQRCARLLPHAQALIDSAHGHRLASLSLGRLLTQTASYLRTRRLDLIAAHDLHEQALAIYRRLHRVTILIRPPASTMLP